MLIGGNAVWRCYWRREKHKQMTYLATLDRAGFKDEKDIAKVLAAAEKLGAADEVTYTKKLIDSPYLDDFDIKHVPFFQFYPDVEMVDTGKMRYMIERDTITLEELQDEAEIFGYDKTVMGEIEELAASGKAAFTPSIGRDYAQRYNDLFASINSTTTTSDDKKTPLLTIDKMWMGSTVAVFINEKYNLTGEEGMPNPYDVKKNPFIFGHDITIPHSYFAHGEIDSIKKLEDGQNDLLNMRFDNLLQSMLNYWFVNPKLFVDDDDFVPSPGSVSRVRDTERAAKVIPGANVTPTVYKEASELYGTIQRISGINDYVKGEEGETLAGRTYGGLRLVQEMANARFIIKSRLFEKLTLKSMGYFILELSKQFLSEDRVRRMFGENGDIETKKLSVGKLKSIKGFMDMKVIPNSSMVIDQQAEAVKMNALADRFLTDKGPFANIPDEVYDKFLLKFLPLYGVSDAVYWVRAIRDNRTKLENEAKKIKKAELAPKTPAPTSNEIATPPGLPSTPGPIVPPGSMPSLSPTGITNQPNPLEAILNSGALPPVGGQ
jgi:hypothetical protein